MTRPGLSSADRLAIAGGGVLGATCRWALSRVFDASHDAADWFVYAPNTGVVDTIHTGIIVGRTGTAIANLAGCLLLGAVTALLARTSGPSRRRVLLAAGTGFCGALTTFATFAIEGAQSLRLARASAVAGPAVDHSLGAALGYLVLSLAGGALAFWIGRATAQRSDQR